MFTNPLSGFLALMRGIFIRWQPDFIVSDELLGFEHDIARLTRYQYFTDYYNNIIYSNIVRYAEQHKEVENLYKFTRAVYNPVRRDVDFFPSAIYPGQLDLQDAERGAIPIETPDTPDGIATRDAIIQLWKDSKWNVGKGLYVRNGAMLGDSLLKVVDDVQKKQVRLEVLDPRKITNVTFDAQNIITEITISNLIQDNSATTSNTANSFVLHEIWTADEVQTFKDDELFPFFENAMGELVSTWDNEYGYVPIFPAQHINVGMEWGQNAYAASLRKIDELNDAASIVIDGARKQVNFPIIAKNVANNGGATVTKDENDELPIFHISGDNAGLEPMTPNINLADGLQVIASILKEIERDLPELSLNNSDSDTPQTATEARIRGKGAENRVQESAPNYDNSLIEAQKSAISIGGFRGYDGYQGFSLESRDNGDLDHMIKPRRLIEDELSKSERSQLILQAAESPAAAVVLKILDVAQDDIETIVLASTARQRAFVVSQGDNEEVIANSVDDDEATIEDEATVVTNSQPNETDLLNAQRLLS